MVTRLSGGGRRDAHIKSLIWREAALAYIYLIPTGLFKLHLVVSDQDLQRPCTEIMQSLQYNLCSPNTYSCDSSPQQTPLGDGLYPSSVTNISRQQPLNILSTFSGRHSISNANRIPRLDG